MEEEKKICEGCVGHCKTKCKKHSNPGCAYGLAFVGALVYFLQTATSFWGGVLGVIKAMLWPAFLIYKLLGFLGM